MEQLRCLRSILQRCTGMDGRAVNCLLYLSKGRSHRRFCWKSHYNQERRELRRYHCRASSSAGSTPPVRVVTRDELSPLLQMAEVKKE